MIGSFFYYQTPPHPPHPFVVIAPSLEQKGWFICVNLTTMHQGAAGANQDVSCQIQQYEYPTRQRPPGSGQIGWFRWGTQRHRGSV